MNKEKIIFTEEDIDHLEQSIVRLVRESEALKSFIDEERIKNAHYLACMTEQRNKYKTALEEIRDEARDKYANGTFSARSEALNYIIDKVNEVLK